MPQSRPGAPTGEEEAEADVAGGSGQPRPRPPSSLAAEWLGGYEEECPAPSCGGRAESPCRSDSFVSAAGHRATDGLAPCRVDSMEANSGLCGVAASDSDLALLSGVSPDVRLHVYHCDPVTGFLNKAWLKQAGIPIHHVGVEVYSEEWSFQYYEDTWDDPSVSGVIHTPPKSMTDFEYVESIDLGATPFSIEEVDYLIMMLYEKWPSCSYHITRNNCLTFAEHLVERLQTPKPFPPWLKSVLEVSQNSHSASAIIDCGWSWLKWWQVRKYQQDGLPPGSPPSEGCAPGEGSPRTRSAGDCRLWHLLLHPTQSCSLCSEQPAADCAIDESR